MAKGKIVFNKKKSTPAKTKGTARVVKSKFIDRKPNRPFFRSNIT